MPLELQIVNVREFIRIGAHGTIDWRQSFANLGRIAAECNKREKGRVLVDVRDARSTLTASQVRSLVLIFRDAGFRDRHRLAVLHRAAPAPRANLFVNAAADDGWNACAFDNFEEAVLWLVVSDETDVDSSAQGSEEPAPPPKD